MQQQKEIDLVKLFQVLKTNKLHIFKFTAVLTFFAIIYCIFATPIFTASTLINPPKLSSAGNNIARNLGDMSDMDFSYSWSMQKTDADVAIALFKTNQLKDMVINKFNLLKLNKLKDMDQARGMISGMTKFTPDLKSGFLDISVDNADPKLSAAIANYYIVALGQVISNISYNRTQQKQEFFLQELDKTRDNLHRSQSKLKDFSRRNGVSSGQQFNIVANLATQLQAQLVVAKSQLQAMSLYATSNNPDYKNLQATVNSLEKQVNDVNGQDIKNSSSELPIPSNLAPELANEYSNLERDVLLNEEILKILFRQYENSKIEGYSQMVPTAIEVVDPALVPLHKSKPRRLKIILISVLLGIFFSSLYYLIRNRKKFILTVTKSGDL
jgi:tyrosine-protein kinase Etk/Wzc